MRIHPRAGGAGEDGIRRPDVAGEAGPDYPFTSADRSRYFGYLSRGESALNVPVGGSLTEYQMLEGVLIGSANNYADRLAGDIWSTDAVFASAARAWMDTHGVPGVTICLLYTSPSPRDS